MNFDQLEKIIARNSSNKTLQIKSTAATAATGNGDTTIGHNTSINTQANNQHDNTLEVQQTQFLTHISPKDTRNSTNNFTVEKSFFTNDNISFNLQTTQQSSCTNNETMGLLKEQLTKIKLLTNDLQIKDQQIEIIKEQVQELENDKQQLEQHIYEIQKSIRFNEDDFNIRLLSLQEKNESLIEFNQQLQQRIQIQNEQIQQYQQDLAQYRIAIDNYDQDKQNLINEVSQVKGVLKGIQQSTIGNREQMALLLSDNENRAIEIEKKKRQIEQAEQQNEKNKNKIEKLEKKIFQKDEKINEMELQLQKMEKLTNENQKYSQENSQLRVDLNALKIRFEESMRSLEDTRAGLARQIQNKNSLEESVESLQRDLQQSKKAHAELKKKSEQLINENLQMKEQLIEFEQINMRLQRDQDLIIQELGEFAKDKLDEFEGDQVLNQLRNHSASLMMLVNQQENINNINVNNNKNSNNNYSQFNEEDEANDDNEDQDESYPSTHNRSAQDSSMSFANQSRASIKGFQNAIISNRLASLDAFQKKDKKRNKSNPKLPQQSQQKKQNIQRKKSLQSQNESHQIQQSLATINNKLVDMEGMGASEQLRTRIGYLASMVSMYKKKVEILENQQQNLNTTIEKLQDHVDQLQKMTAINKAQQENSLFIIKEEYEEKIMKMKELFEQNEEDYQNKLYNCDEQVIALQGEIEYLKHQQEQKNDEIIDIQSKYFEADKQARNLSQLQNELQNMQNKMQVAYQIIEQFLFGFSAMYQKLQNRLKDLTFSKKFLEYYNTLNNVLNPQGIKSTTSSNEQQQKKNNQISSKKQYIYRLFRKSVYSILFLIKIKQFNGKGDPRESSYGNWPNKTIKTAFIFNKYQSNENLLESIKRIIDKNISRNHTNKEQDVAVFSISEIIEKFNQLSQLSLSQQYNSRYSQDDQLLLKFQKDANKVSKMIKQNETFQSELNKMTQRVLGLSEYTRQIEGQFKDQEKIIENKYLSDINQKDITIQQLKSQLSNSNTNTFSQSNNNNNNIENNLQSSYSNGRNSQHQQFNSPPSNNFIYNSQMIPPLPMSSQSYQQQQQQQLQTSHNTEESRSQIKNQSSLIRKYYTQQGAVGNEYNGNVSQSQNNSQKALSYSTQQDLHNRSQDYYHQHSNDASNVEPSHSAIPNDHISVDSLQNELSKIMQRKNQRDSSNHSSASKLVKCPGKIIRNTNK